MAWAPDPADALFVDDQTDYCDGARALGIETRLIVRHEWVPPEGYRRDQRPHGDRDSARAALTQWQLALP